MSPIVCIHVLIVMHTGKRVGGRGIAGEKQSIRRLIACFWTGVFEDRYGIVSVVSGLFAWMVHARHSLLDRLSVVHQSWLPHVPWFLHDWCTNQHVTLALLGYFAISRYA